MTVAVLDPISGEETVAVYDPFTVLLYPPPTVVTVISFAESIALSISF